MLKSTNICYPLLLIASIKKRSFTALGQVIQKSGDTIRRLLRPVSIVYALLDHIAIELFKNKKELVFTIDETLLKKAFSRFIEGTDKFFDTLIGRKIMSYKLLVGGLTDGHYMIPLRFEFLPSKNMLATAAEFREELVKKMIFEIQKRFPDKTIIVAADGAFATTKLLKWALDNKIKMEVRMHSNRVIKYKGEKIKIRQINDLLPKGRHMARTIKAIWHDLTLNITAERRIDKHGEESIVYQAATYEASPSKHVAIYKNRWPIEKFNRTSKQHLGLQECFSTKLDTQSKHVASVLLAYALAQVEMKKQKLSTPEDSIRSLRQKNFDFLERRFEALDQIFEGTHA